MIDTTLPETLPPSVGQILKTSRLAQELTLEQASKHLFISKRQLAHLEDDADHLTCDVYTLGFVRLYAQYLKLDAQEIIEKFKEQNIDHPQSPQAIFPAPLPGRGIPSFPILALSLSVLATIIVGWKWISKDAAPPFPPEVVLKANSSPVLASSITEEVASVEEVHAIPEPMPQQVNLQITEKSWIEVKDQEGNIIISRMFRPGESFELKNSENLILNTGNVKGTHLSFGEKVFPVSEKFDEVGQDIPLNPEKWLE